MVSEYKIEAARVIIAPQGGEIVARITRMIIPDQETVYHVISRTVLDGYPLGDEEKDELVKILLKFSKLYFTEVLGFCAMGNHFHLLVRMQPESDFSDDEIKSRHKRVYGGVRELPQEKVSAFRFKWASLSELVREIKQTFSRYFNKRHNRRGTLWGERFKSLIVEDGEALINCLAYIDLNPLRANIVKCPEDYRWSSLGHHVQTGNKGNFLSFEFGLEAFSARSRKERLRRYRRFVYEAAALKRSRGKSCMMIDEKIIEKESKTDFKNTRAYKFRYRTRYFSDSGIIGSKAFVSKKYKQFKDIFHSKHEKKPKPIKGLVGIYSLKRLSNS
jgi:putative transposase